MAINRGDLNEAERLLQQTDLRTAEWHYLMGRLYYHRGWLDDAAQEFEMACGMDPNNPEYQQAYQICVPAGALTGRKDMARAALCSATGARR